MCEPQVAAYYTIIPYDGVASQYSRPRVYDHMVSYLRMTLYTLYGISVFIELETLCAERYTLIQLNMVAYYAGLAYHHTRAVVNKEVVPYSRIRMDIYTRYLVGVFRHYPRDKGDIQQISWR